MKTANFPRFTVIKGNFYPLKMDKDWLISICSVGDKDAPIAEGKFEKILFMKFDDTHEEGPDHRGITVEQAKEIADFIKDAREQNKNVWANCQAGISRSGAIVAILMSLGWEFHETGLSPFRLPNSLVFKRVRQFFPEIQWEWEVKSSPDYIFNHIQTNMLS